METEINMRDQQIHEIEIREKDKEQKMSMELKVLQQQRENLVIQKNQIEEDFKQADQAFNEEVSLRLKFEHKINEIHGLHRELQLKHQMVVEQLLKTKQVRG